MPGMPKYVHYFADYSEKEREHRLDHVESEESVRELDADERRMHVLHLRRHRLLLRQGQAYSGQLFIPHSWLRYQVLFPDRSAFEGPHVRLSGL